MKQVVLFLLLGFTFFSCEKKNTTLKGSVFGTYYSVTYDSDKDHKFEKSFDSIFSVLNKSMSTYLPSSDISKLNKNEDVTVDEHFIKVFEASKQIYKATDGAFDPTIGVMVNAWNFGPEGQTDKVDSLQVKELMRSVGMEKLQRDGNKIVKANPDTYLDFNAIAKGYGIDVIAEFLESNGIGNYVVEIGGEVRAKGSNIEKERPWNVGLEMPRYDGSQSILRTVELHDEAMATSGTYRKFKTDSLGNRFSHIIDTSNGYPSQTNLLSISVIAKDCMTADAYATAFKSMGIERIETFLKSHPELKTFLIFENEQKEFETLALNGFPE